tara:strand:- start:2996 stop:3559 length:564 start_codon:yes stop_codon:yes gene_type:complete
MVENILDDMVGGESFYDPSEDTPNVITPEGEYYAHIKDVTVKEDVVIRGKYLADIYNIIFKLAHENSDKEFNGISGSRFVGKEVRSKGFFRFKTPDSPNLEPNTGGNGGYKAMVESLGLKVEEKEVNGKTVYALPSINPADVEGLPAIIKVGHDTWKNRDGEDVISPQAVGVFKWANGKREEADLPF